MPLGLLGLCTKRELKREVNKEKVKSYKHGYDDAVEEINYLNEQIFIKDEQINELRKVIKNLRNRVREERHHEVRRIRAIHKRTKKLRVKKKCEARIDKIYLSK